MLHPELFEQAMIGGRKVGHWDPVKQGKEIDFSSIQGVRCVMPPPSRAEAETKPAKSVEKEDQGGAGNGV